VFVTFEGIDRSGKSTQAALLHEALGPTALFLREPGGTDIGEALRDIVKDTSRALDSRTELLLFCAARAALCAEVIEGAMRDKRDVICDRFIDSTTAYQGVARGLGTEIVSRINEFAIDQCCPDLTLYLRIDPDVAEQRGQQRLASGLSDGTDRFESEGPEFQRQVAQAYDALARRYPERIVVIEAKTSREDVHAQVMRHVRDRR
jgi:dTMP kinase